MKFCRFVFAALVAAQGFAAYRFSSADNTAVNYWRQCDRTGGHIYGGWVYHMTNSGTPFGALYLSGNYKGQNIKDDTDRYRVEYLVTYGQPNNYINYLYLTSNDGKIWPGVWRLVFVMRILPSKRVHLYMSHPYSIVVSSGQDTTGMTADITGISTNCVGAYWADNSTTRRLNGYVAHFANLDFATTLNGAINLFTIGDFPANARNFMATSVYVPLTETLDEASSASYGAPSGSNLPWLEMNMGTPVIRNRMLLIY